MAVNSLVGNRGARGEAPAAMPPMFGRGGFGPFVGKIERARDTRGTVRHL